MEFDNGILQFSAFMSVTLGIVVLFVGKRVNDVVVFLREFSIPEPVTGGLIASLLVALLCLISGIEISFDMAARDVLLIYFFTTIGINSSLKDLLAGGKPLVILLLITIAWSPRIAEDYGISNAMEVGIACATFGLILASLMGGPIAKFLITRHNLTPEKVEQLDIGVAEKQSDSLEIDHLDFLDAILAIHVCAIFGFLINYGLAGLGLKLPLFVTCLFAGILITNLIPKSFPRFSGRVWPSRKPAIALIADISLGTFLAMSLMSMQLWTLVELAGPIFTILGAQFLIAVSVTLFVVFPLMGRSYDAAVVCAGFGGISLGSTPTAMANMSAVAQRYGSSHLAFIIVPLVCAFFIDLVNALLIPFFLTHF